VDDVGAACRSIHSLRTFLASMHGTEATNVSFGKIQHIITQSLKSVQNVLINDKHCVELYGYDIMIDQDLKPWLIEVNASPALSSDNERDYELKFNLIEDFYTCLVRGYAPSLPLGGGLDAVPMRRRGFHQHCDTLFIPGDSGACRIWRRRSTGRHPNAWAALTSYTTRIWWCATPSAHPCSRDLGLPITA
jgi:hypothetical protein